MEHAEPTQAGKDTVVKPKLTMVDDAYGPTPPVTGEELLFASEILLRAGFREEALLLLTRLVGEASVKKLLRYGKDETNG